MPWKVFLILTIYRDSKCVTITIFGKTASSYVNIDHWLSITKNPIYEADAADNIIIPSDHFWHTSEHRHLCVVSELVGPELFQLTNNGGTGKPLPADWLWKIFKEALSSLRFMHSHNIVHGCKISPRLRLFKYWKESLLTGTSRPTFIPDHRISRSQCDGRGRRAQLLQVGRLQTVRFQQLRDLQSR